MTIAVRDSSFDTATELGQRDWDQWVSASRTRNWCRHNTLQDWLERWGDRAGFERDAEPDEATDFQRFIFAKGHEFEAAVLRCLGELASVTKIDCCEWATKCEEAVELTRAAMVRGEPIIHQGVLWNPENRTYGAADLLVRSDVLRHLFPEAISEDESRVGAPALGAANWHYRVIDIKFTTLRLNKNWEAASDHLAYMVQTFIYNEALGRLQGYLPPASYLLGRSWTGPKDTAGNSCLDRLAPVPHDLVRGDESLRDIAGAAIAWVRHMRMDGAVWDPHNPMAFPELRPNLSEASSPWAGATKAIAQATADPTLAWQVAIRGRELAREAGVLSWRDERFDAALVGLTGKRADTLDQMLSVNRNPAALPVNPPYIRANRDTWGEPGPLEFYVDFETVSDINDDFSRLPERGGQAQIFMIGCGHIENGEWQFSCFIADELTLECEATVIERWLAHMEAVRARLAPGLKDPLVFHWSPAESSGLTDGLKSARTRHAERSVQWKEPNWFDFLGKVMKEEPVIIRGPMGFGLKNVARSMKAHGLIETEWSDSVVDGLGAMIGAWDCYASATESGALVAELPLMQEIRDYNEVDCRVMWEVVGYLRWRTTRDL